MPEGTITALRSQERDRQRVNVFIDGTFALGVSHKTLTSEALFVGKHLDAEAWARLEAAEYTNQALQAAFRFLQARPRSTAEVRERLQRKQHLPAQAIEAAIRRLTELGFLDDAAFARFWVENRNTSRPRGQHALREELSRKGIDRDLIAATLSDDDLVGDEYERAVTLARAALHKYANAPDYATFQRRLGGYMQRRGFSYDTIRAIVEMLWRDIRS